MPLVLEEIATWTEVELRDRTRDDFLTNLIAQGNSF